MDLPTMPRVDKGIPLPPASASVRYPFHLMEIGDSFFILKGRQKGSSVYKGARRAGIAVTTRVVQGGIRVWRIQ